MEEVGAFGGGQPSAVEVLQPPQIKALPGQRVHVADRQVLGHATIWRRAERDLMQFAAHHRHGRPAPTGRAWVLGNNVAQLGGQFVAVGGGVRPGQVYVDDEVVGVGSGDRVDGEQRRRQPLAIGHGRHQMQLLPGQFVTAGDELATGLFEDLDVFERADLVVLARDNLEQRARDRKCVAPEGRSRAPALRRARRYVPHSPARRDCRRGIAGFRAHCRRSARAPCGSAARRTSGTAGCGRCRRLPGSAPGSRRSAARVPRPAHR